MNLPKIVILVAVATAALPAAAEELVMTLQLGEGDGVLQVDAVPGQPVRTIAELTDPGITSAVWALKGMVRYEGVEGDGYLQLDNHFGARGSYFTRSLAASGPLGKISGSSDWRPFTLPFYANRGDQAGTMPPQPEALTLSMVMPGAGTVYLRDVALYQYSDDDPMAGGAWPGGRTAILVGAIGGSFVGIWGALIGLLASRGKARRFVIGSANLLIFAGFASLAAGVAALVSGQPYATWYPLLLLGIILVVVVSALRRILPRRYEAHELKKMQSMDA